MLPFNNPCRTCSFSFVYLMSAKNVVAILSLCILCATCTSELSAQIESDEIKLNMQEYAPLWWNLIKDNVTTSQLLIFSSRIVAGLYYPRAFATTFNMRATAHYDTLKFLPLPSADLIKALRLAHKAALAAAMLTLKMEKRLLK